MKEQDSLQHAAMGPCGAEGKGYALGTLGYDAAFLREHALEVVELKGVDGLARVLVVPAWQGRVMTSGAGDLEGGSYGWINYKYIASGQHSTQFNPVGGEERFWLGPEGGAFSYYFKPGDEQVFGNWQVPALLDTEPFAIETQEDDFVEFAKETVLQNASGVSFEMRLRRRVALLDEAEAGRRLGTELPKGVKMVAYETRNAITNCGSFAWTKETGLPSVWMLGMFNPSPTTTVFIPYKEEAEGPIVNDMYFGKVPADRLVVRDGVLRFRIDGKFRSKIGIPAPRALELCGSYDSQKKVLTLLKFTLPAGEVDYVNGQWGVQEDAFHGDVINAYNDGPVEDGSIMGPFYEIETSSPGAALAPGETLVHTQAVMHLQGEEAALGALVQTLLGVSLEEIAGTFR